jgi:hypothetical protein
MNDYAKHAWSWVAPPAWPIPPVGWYPTGAWCPNTSWPVPPLDWQGWACDPPLTEADREADAGAREGRPPIILLAGVEVPSVVGPPEWDFSLVEADLSGIPIVWVPRQQDPQVVRDRRAAWWALLTARSAALVRHPAGVLLELGAVERECLLAWRQVLHALEVDPVFAREDVVPPFDSPARRAVLDSQRIWLETLAAQRQFLLDVTNGNRHPDEYVTFRWGSAQAMSACLRACLDWCGEGAFRLAQKHVQDEAYGDRVLG